MNPELYEPVTESGCWIWLGRIHKQAGYGYLARGGKFWFAHRYSWTKAHGPIPKGMWVLHKCDVRACVNPAHLFLGTYRDNIDDMVRKGRSKLSNAWRAQITHCPKGHAYDEQNTGVRDGKRFCKACRKASARESIRRLNAGLRTRKPSTRTHCIRGHVFDQRNTYMSYGTKICRKCRSLHKRTPRETRHQS